MVEAGQLRPVIDRAYPFEEAATAIDYAAKQTVGGKVVVMVAGPVS